MIVIIIIILVIIIIMAILMLLVVILILNPIFCTSVRQLLRQRLINVEPAVVCGLHILLVHGLRTAVPCISCCWWRHLPCYLSWPLPSVWFLQHILSLTATGCALNIGCTKNYQPIEVTVQLRALRALKVSYSDVGEGGVALNCDKLKQLIRQGLRNTLYSLQAHGWVHAVDQCVFCASPFMSRTECSNHEKAKCLNHQNICYRVGHGCCRIQQYIW